MRESSLAEPTDLEPSSAAANPDQVSPEGWAIKLKLLLALPVVTIAHIPSSNRRGAFRISVLPKLGDVLPVLLTAKAHTALC